MDTAGVVKTDSAYYFLYVIEDQVCYMVFCETGIDKQVALNYIDSIRSEFKVRYGAELVGDVRKIRDYAFQDFGMLVLVC